MKKFSLFVFLVFFVMGCGVSRKAASHSVQKDSLIYKEIVRVDTLRVPQDRVQVVVDNTILNLKEKEIQDLNYQFLQYKQTTGSRANINFKILKDSVYIEGTVVKDTILKAIHNSQNMPNRRQKVVKDTILKAIHNYSMLASHLCIVVKDTILKAIHTYSMLASHLCIVVKDTILKAIHNLAEILKKLPTVVKDTILKAIHNTKI